MCYGHCRLELGRKNFRPLGQIVNKHYSITVPLVWLHKLNHIHDHSVKRARYRTSGIVTLWPSRRVTKTTQLLHQWKSLEHILGHQYSAKKVLPTHLHPASAQQKGQCEPLQTRAVNRHLRELSWVFHPSTTVQWDWVRVISCGLNSYLLEVSHCSGTQGKVEAYGLSAHLHWTGCAKE